MTSILDEMRLARFPNAANLTSAKARYDTRMEIVSSCEVCCEDTVVAMSPCCGLICETCLWKSFTITIKETFGMGVIANNCPYCMSELDDEYVEGLLAPDVVELLHQNRRVQFPARVSYIHCKWCEEEFHVSEAYVADGENVTVIAGEVAHAVTCPHCYQDVCRECGGRFPGHFDKTCIEYLRFAVRNKGEWDTFTAKNFEYYFNASSLPKSAKDPYMDEVQKSVSIAKQEEELRNFETILQITKFCPDCKTRIEKNGGCNHHTHHCPGSTRPAEFCWICLSLDALGVPLPEGRLCEHGITRHVARF